MPPLVPDEIENYAFEHTRPEPADLQALARRTREEMPHSQMLTGRVEGRLLKLIAALVRPRFILEVGTYTGYSALSLAEGAPDGAKLVTCEIDPAAAAVARAAFDSSPVGHKIEIRMGPALDTIARLEHEIDLAFIDADKERYPDYYETILARTRPGGILVFDNMLWSGKVLAPDDHTSRVLDALNRTIAADGRVENVLLTVRDGIQLVRKL